MDYRVGSNPMIDSLIKGGKFRQSHREKNANKKHLTFYEWRIRMMHPQVKECQGFLATPEARKREGRIFPKGLQTEHGSANTLISNF